MATVGHTSRRTRDYVCGSNDSAGNFPIWAYGMSVILLLYPRLSHIIATLFRLN
ncbi:hypothetical protein K503DRAFT_777773, partial [Rhizopogon vinicolor AM-OR11-026]